MGGELDIIGLNPETHDTRGGGLAVGREQVSYSVLIVIIVLNTAVVLQYYLYIY